MSCGEQGLVHIFWFLVPHQPVRLRRWGKGGHGGLGILRLGAGGVTGMCGERV